MTQDSPVNVDQPVDLTQHFEFRLHHGGVSVVDLDASVQWYCDMLGFEVESRFEIPPVPAKVAVLKRGAVRMELFEVAGAAPLPEDRRHPDRDLRTCGNKHVAFATQDAALAISELKARGADIALVVMSPLGGGPGAFIRDNSGNLIEIVQEPSLWASAT